MAYQHAVLGEKIYPGAILKDSNVQVQRLVAPLVRFLVRASDVHLTLFLEPMVITSGNDGQHAVGSAHFRNAAVDLRTTDKHEAQHNLFLMALVQLGAEDHIGVFDERTKPGEGHFHCEVLA